MSKFTDATCEALYLLSLDGLCVAEAGSVQENGWHGLLVDTGIKEAPHAILHEDSQGFVTYDVFETEALAEETFGDY